MDDEEIHQLKKIYNQYLDKKRDNMRNTQFKVEHLFGDILCKESISP